MASRPTRLRKQVQPFGAVIRDGGSSGSDSDDSGGGGGGGGGGSDGSDGEVAVSVRRPRVPRAGAARRHNPALASAAAGAAGPATATAGAPPGGGAASPPPSHTTAAGNRRNALWAAVSSGRGVEKAVGGVVAALREGGAAAGGARAAWVNLFFAAAGAVDDVVTPGVPPPDGSDAVAEVMGEAGALLGSGSGSEGGYALAAEVVAGSLTGDGGEEVRPPPPAGLRAGLAAVQEALVAGADGDTLLGDGDFAFFMLEWLCAANASKHRALRHTATFFAMTTGAALLRRRAALAADGATWEAQLGAERAIAAALGAKKGGGAAAARASAEQADKVARLEGAVADGAACAAACAGWVAKAFSAIFVYRYRDVAPEVRADALAGLVTWMTAAPADYATNAYLKHLGWMLSDAASATVRHLALRGILAVFDATGGARVGTLKDLVERFRPRIGDMTRDVAPAVAVAALTVLRVASEHGMRSPDDFRAAADALLDATLPVRRAAGALLLTILPAFASTTGGGGGGGDDDAPAAGDGGGEGPAGGSGRRGSRGGGGAAAAAARAVAAAAATAARRARTQLTSLVFVIDAALPDGVRSALADPNPPATALAATAEVADAVVSALWGATRVLTAWDGMLQLLKDGGRLDPELYAGAAHSAMDAAAEDELPPAQLRMLLALLLAAFTAASGGGSVGGVPLGVPTTTVGELTTEREAVARSRDDASAALLPHLADLLFAHGDDAWDAEQLCARLLRRLAPSAWASPGAGKALADVAFHLQRLLELHSEEAPLAAAAGAYAALAAGDHAKCRDAEARLRALLESLAARASRLLAVAAAPPPPPPVHARGARGGASRTSGDGEGGEAGAAAAALAGVLRRLRLLVAAAPSTCLPDDLAGGAGDTPLVDALFGFLADARRLSALADAAAAGAGGAGGGRAAAGTGAPNPPARGVPRRLARGGGPPGGAGAAAGAAGGGAGGGGAPGGGARRGGARRRAGPDAGAITALVLLRDELTRHLTAFLTLRHPARVAAGARDAGWPSAPPAAIDAAQAGDDGCDDLPPLTADSYRLDTPDVPLAARVYVWRLRAAAFGAAELLLRTLAPATLLRTALFALALPVDDGLAAGVTTFVNAALGAPAADVAAMGVYLPGVSEALAENARKSAAGVAGGGGGRSGAQSVAALYAEAAAAEGEGEEVAAAVARAKAAVILLPLARMSLAAPFTPRLGHLVGRRLLEEENEAGAAGVAVAKAHSRRLKDVSPDAWLSQQLHSIEEACRTLGRLGEEAAASGSGDADDDGAAAAAAAAGERAGFVIARMMALLKRHLQLLGVGRVQRPWWAPLTRALQVGIESAVGGAPGALLTLPFLTLLLASLPLHLVPFLSTTTAAAVSRLEADGAASLAAASSWWRAVLAGSSPTTTLPGERGRVPGADGIAASALAPWVPLAAFQRALAAMAAAALAGGAPPRGLHATLNGEAGAAGRGARGPGGRGGGGGGPAGGGGLGGGGGGGPGGGGGEPVGK